jgi:SRSO17 transposase
MSEYEVPICEHIKACGSRCVVAALKGRRYCHFHDEAEKRRRASARITRRLAKRTRRNINIPVLEDANAIQVALMETIHALIDQRLERKDASLLFYALQTASANVKSMDLVERPPKWSVRSEMYARLYDVKDEIRSFEKWEEIERNEIREELEEEMQQKLAAAESAGGTDNKEPATQ